jgi:hypothetical protein
MKLIIAIIWGFISLFMPDEGLQEIEKPAVDRQKYL